MKLVASVVSGESSVASTTSNNPDDEESRSDTRASGFLQHASGMFFLKAKARQYCS